MDEDALELRSDDDDTNFEDSEDELREAVADSMINLFVMEEKLEVHDGMEEQEEDSQQIRQAVGESPADAVSSEPEGAGGRSDGNTTSNQPPTI
ncbi:hypothetical protein CgunFtcFv8_024154 [Champsocephalus gunnari]|uniref:Uncharacterized protein n=1 Tax=Champsocephalus gunnari TaxID=52237 RepID=A0AAN8HM67_CHAGU|nr:hypothetical protein CgunFtcFv8_024154 [Champsocephalus gunnari]